MKYVLDSHTHTIASGHAYSTIHEMAQEASRKGLQLLGITEHSMRLPGACHEFYFQNLKVLRRQMYGIEVLFGAEVNIMDERGTLDMEERLLKQMDVVIASLHTPCIRPGTRKQNTDACIHAMENPYVNIIGHPDDSRYPLDYDALVRAAKEHEVLLELNNSSYQPEGSREDPMPNDLKMLELCMKYQVPIILGSDAHTQEDVGNHRELDGLLEQTGFPEKLVVNRSVEEYKKYINRYRHGRGQGKGGNSSLQ